jgi:uncharacterized iron-regulated membrane protein
VRARKLFLKVHLYLGLTAGIVLAVTGLGGSLLVFSDEWDAALNPRLLQAAAGGGTTAPLQRVTEAVRAAHPTEKIHRVRMPRHAGDTYEFWMDAGEGLRVYADPYTGEVLGSRVYRQSLRGFLFTLHTRLLAGEWGKSVVGVLAFMLLTLGASGVLLWWRGAKNIRRGLTVNRRAGWRRANYDLHNVIGIFAVALLSVSAFTGVHLVFNAPFERVVNWLTSTPQRPPAPASTPRPGAVPVSLDEVVERARQVWPEGSTTWVYLPANERAVFMVRKRLGAESHPNGKSFVYLDQFTGEVVRAESALEAPTAARLINNLYPLHIGVMGGAPTRVLQVLVGLTPAALLISGFLIWRNRSRKRSGL